MYSNIQRGDIVLFSWNCYDANELRCGPHVNKFHHIRMLGIVLSSRIYYVGHGDTTVQEQTLLTILNIGRFHSLALSLPDYWTAETFQERSIPRLTNHRVNSIYTHNYPRNYSDLDIICIHKRFSYHLCMYSSNIEWYPRPSKITVTEYICKRPSEIRNFLTSWFMQISKTYEAIKLWCSLRRWKRYCERIKHIETQNAICLQKYTRRFLNNGTLHRLKLRKKWWNIHKNFPYIQRDSTQILKSYRVEGINVFLPTKALVNSWSTFMKQSILKISSVAKRTVEQRIRYSWFCWRSSIHNQDNEIQLMRGNDIYSYVVSMSSPKTSATSTNLPVSIDSSVRLRSN